LETALSWSYFSDHLDIGRGNALDPAS